MWAGMGRECFMEIVRFELSLEEFKSKEIGWLSPDSGWYKESALVEKRETTKRLD